MAILLLCNTDKSEDTNILHISIKLLQLPPPHLYQYNGFHDIITSKCNKQFSVSTSCAEYKRDEGTSMGSTFYLLPYREQTSIADHCLASKLHSSYTTETALPIIAFQYECLPFSTTTMISAIKHRKYVSTFNVSFNV